MLKTNSKKAIENIKAYIMEHYTPYDYEDFNESDDFQTVATNILDTMRKQKSGDWYNRNMSDQQRFEDWCQGLPSLFDACYYYNRPAIDDLGDILEETAEERNRYTKEQAEKMLTALIYRELRKGER